MRESDNDRADERTGAQRAAPKSPAVTLDAAEGALARGYLPLKLTSATQRVSAAARVAVLTLGAVTVGRLQFDPEIEIATGEAINFHVNFPLRGQTRTNSSSGWEVINGPGSGMVFSPGSQAAVRWSPGVDLISVMIDAPAMVAELEMMLGHSVSGGLRFDPHLNLDSAGTAPWMDAVRMIVRQMNAADDSLEHPLIRRRVEQLIAGSVLASQHHNYSDELLIQPSGRESRAVSHALQLIHDRPELPWTLAELGQATGLSARALQTGLKSATGQGPAALLRTVRMARAHDDLLMADPATTTVAAVAHRWGFFHLGRFAAAYRQRYGHNPSYALEIRQ